MPLVDNSGSARGAPKPIWANVVLGVFIVYTVMLFVLALNETFGWGLFPSALDKQLTAQVGQLGDTKLTLEQKEALAQEIVSWGSFAVPPLIQGIDRGTAEEKKNAAICLVVLAKRYYNVDLTSMSADPSQLRHWWSDMQAQWEKMEKKSGPA